MFNFNDVNIIALVAITNSLFIIYNIYYISKKYHNS